MTKAVTYVEIDYDLCSHEYSTSPCAAALGTTGAAKCFNTRATCQDPDNYLRGSITLRFVMPSGYDDPNIVAIPSIQSVSTTPARIRPGNDLGERASVSIKFKDHATNDQQTDKYWRERRTGAAQDSGEGYRPEDRGTFWGKFRARFPYYRTRALRLIQGEAGQSLASMTTRHYVMDSITGPTSDGTFTITAKDVLKLADDDQAQCPKATDGKLTQDISESQTGTVAVDAAAEDYRPPGGGGLTYSFVIVCIGNEVIYLNPPGVDNNTVDIQYRGQDGTTAESHSSGDTLQRVVIYDGKRPSEIAADLLINYANVPSQFIDQTAWDAESDNYIGRLYGAEITEPTSVRDLLSQLCQQVGFSLWWDEIAQQIRFRVIRQPDVSPALLTDESDFIDGKSSIKEQPDKRVSQVWVFYGVIDPTEKVDEARNYRSVYVLGDADAESDNEYAKQQIKKVYARWISRFNQPAAQGIAERLLSRYVDPPRQFTFSLPWNSKRAYLGATVDAQTRLIQTFDGSAAQTRVFITSYEQGSERVNVIADEFLYIEPPSASERRVVIDANAYNVDARQAYDNIYPSADTDLPIIIEVSSGVIVGSTSTSQPALTIDNFPANADITLVVNGRIQGAGGKGGQGYGDQSGGPFNGYGGGDALYTRHALTLDGDGNIWSGAGGGGGGGSGSSHPGDQNAGGGGGGGAGYQPGDGGVGGNSQDQSHGNRGSAGTTEDGGRHGNGDNGGRDGGDGGEPGQNGANGPVDGAGGGSAGNSIDGSSYITQASGASVDIRGAQVN